MTTYYQKMFLLIDGIYYSIKLIAIDKIKTWKKQWGTLYVNNESINPTTENIYTYRNILTLPCLDSRSWCIRLKYGMDYSFKIRTFLCLEVVNKRLELKQVKEILRKRYQLFRDSTNNIMLRKISWTESLGRSVLRLNNLKQTKLLVRTLSVIKFTLTSKLIKSKNLTNIFKYERSYKVISALTSKLNLNVHKFIFNINLHFNSRSIVIYNDVNASEFKKHHFVGLIINHLNKIRKHKITSLRYSYYLIVNRLSNICLIETDLNLIVLTTKFIELLIKVQLKTTKLLKTLSKPELFLEWRNISMLNYIYLNYLLSFTKIKSDHNYYALINFNIFIINSLKHVPNVHLKSFTSIH
ncbi:hypothetical protein magsdc_251 [Candidatus Hodgkinia cicadicola]|nr:hypothetical protein magsdc_251 [Candidatus Hodgkinia cicadicola]